MNSRMVRGRVDPRRNTRHPGYEISQTVRKLLETVLGDPKQHGTLLQVKVRGRGQGRPGLRPHHDSGESAPHVRTDARHGLIHGLGVSAAPEILPSEVQSFYNNHLGGSLEGQSVGDVIIPRSVVERVLKHRGKEHIYDNLDPTKTALLVVDLQNAFMLPGVAHALCESAPSIVPNVNWLAESIRDTGGTVVWIKSTFGKESLNTWPVLHEMAGPERTARRLGAMSEGTKGHEFWAGLDIRPADLIVNKDRYSAFIQGSSNLEELLRQRAIDTVVVTGTVTNVCCESTARDAMMLNFRTIMVTDANAAVTDEDHNASLIAFYLAFGDIMSTAMLVSCLKRNVLNSSLASRAGSRICAS